MMKRTLTLLLTLALLCAALGSCQGSSTSENAEPARKAANEMVLAIAQDLDDTLDPHYSVSAGTKEIMFNVFEGLVKPDAAGNLIPALAESWEVSPDGLTYTFTLREGVTFHNGKALTAEDVVWSLTRVRDENLIAAFSNLAELQGEGNTVTLTLTAPQNEFLSYLTVAILPAGYAEAATAPIGTGPFRFVSRTAQDNLVLEKYEGYWGTPAKLDRVTLKVMENGDTTVLSLQSGAVDMATHLTSTQVAQLGEEFHTEMGPMNLVQALYLNNAVEPFTDVRVRQALSYAVDKQALIDTAFDGYGFPIGSSMYPAFAKYFLPELTDYYPHDVEIAKRLLAEAGYPDGFSMTITVPSNYQPHMDTATVLVEQLKEVGVSATILPVEWESWVSDTYVGRNFQSTVVGVDASTMTARALLERFCSDNGRNFINYHSDLYDATFAQAIETYDDIAQTALFKVLERDLTENAANVYLQDMADLVAMRNGLSGVTFYPIYVLDLAVIGWE
ncbi:MAG: ABC transporter substrate-binding protein [bacterium]